MHRISDPLTTLAQRDPGRAFVVTPLRTLTYSEASSRVAHAAGVLRKTGLGPGDRLALYQTGGPAKPEEVIRDILLVLACIRARVIAIPISSRLPAATVPTMLESIGGAPTLDEIGFNPHDLLSGESDAADYVDWELARPASIVFTSGSMGEPKGVLHTLGNHVWSARGWAECIPLFPSDRWMLDLPLSHVSGLAVLFRCLSVGATVAIPDRSIRLTEIVRMLGVTCVSMVSTQLRRALRADAQLDHLKLVLLGGSAFSDATLREARSRRWPISLSYGLTEMASTVTASPLNEPPEALDTAGAVLPYREADLSGEGEVRVRGRVRFAGYATSGGVSKPFDTNGWFSTGDLGEWRDVEGRSMLRITGRRDNMFVSGGENVQPEVIEALLLRQPGVMQAIVVPRPNEEFGHRPVAFVEADSWAPDAWAEAVASEMPGFMVPDAFRPWPEDASLGVKPSRQELARIAGASEC